MVARRSFISIALSVALAGAILTGPPSTAQAVGTGVFIQENLVSDQPGVAAITDPNLVNAWGISHGPTTPVWVSDNGTDLATLYRGAVDTTPVSVAPLTVGIPGGAPTGQVFNDTMAFVLPDGLPASFIFASENGSIAAWNGGEGTEAVTVASSDGAVYKGLALAHTASGPELLAANFHDNRIDVFGADFMPIPSAGMFQDPNLPAGYAPFNVAEINGQIFVTYALQDAQAEDDVAGPGHGFVDVYSTDGMFVRRLVTHSVLNSPWGITTAPSTFGRFGGDLLIGNFGDGRIHAFDPTTGEVLGVLRGTSGRPLMIDGLWALVVGDPAAGGTDAIWFSAGPNDEQHGLLGVLRPQMADGHHARHGDHRHGDHHRHHFGHRR
ncbi:MAG: TIGR03118 family protein [Microlunatus sp.]|nr:TIGR03118 family protein [Microlunatus sp.]